MELKVGQIVYVKPLQSYNGKAIITAEVINIGRKYFQIKQIGDDRYNRFNRDKFKIENGYIVSEYTASWQVRLSLQEIEDERQFNILLSKIYDIFINYCCGEDLSLDQLKRINAIIEEK